MFSLDNSNSAARHPLRVTLDVWSAMFLREMISRTMADRMSWFWMIFEPLATIGVMVGIRAFLMNGNKIGGADFIPWIIVGLMGFYIFRENMMAPMGAVDANRGLFAYRQILPVDPVLVRCFVEGMIRSFIFLIFIFVGELLKLNLLPDFGVGALMDWLSLWALGAGLGVLLSAFASLVPEIGKVVKILSLPLLIISGVIFPLNYIPHQFREYVLWNPVVHGLESMRLSFFSGYHTLDGIHMTYLWLWALSCLTLGLLMHIRFSDRLKSQ